eukprot:SAG11_NODE_429_length_9534_cov_14.689242_9_plen_53_part_00
MTLATEILTALIKGDEPKKTANEDSKDGEENDGNDGNDGNTDIDAAESPDEA